MTPERWKQIEEIYHAAAARPAAERALFLAAACRDDEALRREIESLLAEERSDDDFLVEPALVPAAQIISDLAPGSMTGRDLGMYRLEALLGAGGMGEVYQAEDPRLGRCVAIKILPREFTSNPDRLARFEREARMLASLNHPNICAIYGFEEADGIRFLILEFVAGDTLARRLHMARAGSRNSGLPLGDVLTIARQIVAALEAAHDRGMVHRDLKPANIKITPDGTVKVLDFGLAKTVAGNPSTPEITHDAAATQSVNREGAVIGTAAYMSPEQARGLAVDERTDIWAFGCVLFEMVTGRVAFAGDTVSDSIARILEREPDWSVLPVATPASLRRLLVHCLAKDPKKRLRDIGDARLELDAVNEPVPEIREALARPTPKTSRAALLGWVAVAALGAVIIVRESARPVAPPDDPFANARFTPLTNWPGTEESPEISPDGKFVAFLADRDGQFDVWGTQLRTEDFKNLTQDIAPLEAPGILRTLGFSADGAEVWFGSVARPTMRIPHTGGTARPFLGSDAKTPAWSADGSRLVYFRQDDEGDTLFVSDGTGADARPVEIAWNDDAGGKAHNHNPVWSPDNQWIYFVHGIVRDWNHVSDEMDIWRVAPSGGSPERMTHLNTALTFLTPLDVRTLVYVAREEDGSGPRLWTLDVKTKLSRKVPSGLTQYTSVAASGSGARLVATTVNPTVSLWTVPILDKPALDGEAVPYPVQTERALSPRFGGTSSLFYLSSRGTGDGLWRFEDGKPSQVLKGTDGPLFESPAPSPDGRRVAVVRKREGKHRLTVMWANGTEMRTLAPSIDIQGTADWSPDSEWIVAGGKDPAGRHGLFKIPVQGGDPVKLVDGDATNPVWSPKGTMIVYGGQFAKGQVSLSAVTGDGDPVTLPAVRVSPGGFRFLRDGTGLVYLPRPESLDFSRFDIATGESRLLTRLTNRGSLRGFDVTPDGQHIVFDRTRQNADIVLIELQQK